MAKLKRDKIYVLGDSVYRSETTFLNNIKRLISRQDFENSYASKLIYQIYSISESGTIADYKVIADQTKVSNERDLQLKSLLDQLDPMDNAVLTIINMYPQFETNERFRTNHLRNLNNIKFEINNFKKYIMDNKNYFFARSNDLEWIKSILTIHNFRDCNLGTHYDYSQRKYIKREASNELKEAFKLAKLQLRKTHKNKK